MRRFKTGQPYSRHDLRTVEALEDIRELLYMMLHVQLSGPDAAGNLEPVKRRLSWFAERRTLEVEE